MFIGIRCFVFTTSICIFANLNSVQTLKLFGRSSKVEKLMSIEKRPFKEYDGRISTEAEISLLTKSLGFIVCDQPQLPFMRNFVDHYTSMKEGNAVTLEHISRKHYRRASVEDKVERCQRYLDDAVLRDNQIFLVDDPSWLEEIRAEKKELHFDYYPRKPEMVTAIACPVTIRNRLRTLYIAGVGSVENTEDVQYFVMAERSPNESSKLSILMRTVVQSRSEENEVEIVNDEPELMAESPDRCGIQFTVRDHWTNDDFRLFGKDAEMAYITTLYGFINLTCDQRFVDRFVELVENLKKVYKIKTTIAQYHIEDLSQNEKLKLCSELVDASSLLSKLPIVPVTKEGFEHKIEVKDVEVRYQQLRTSNETHQFLACPIVYVTNNSEQNKITLYVMPVWFEDASRCGGFTFLKLHVPPDGDTSEQELILYSKLVKTSESHDIREIKDANEDDAD